MRIGSKKSDSGNVIKWERSELETLAVYAGVLFVLHFAALAIAAAIATVDLWDQGYHGMAKLLGCLATLVAVFVCFYPMLKVLANHGIFISVYGWIARVIDRQEAVFRELPLMRFLIFRIICFLSWTLIAAVLIINKEAATICHVPTMVFRRVVVIVALVDLFLLAITLIGACRNDYLVEAYEDGEKYKNMFYRA